MKRSKKMLSRFTSMLSNAVEAFAPEMTLLEQFRYHWKCVTQFFLDTEDERIAVENTTIPNHLEQMIEVLKIEEHENGISSAGPAMEFMLQHKILETMQTLGKADCPPGMKRYVLIFFTKLLGKLKQKLLPHVNVHKPINKLIRCCGNVKAGPTETEEVQFLLQVSSKLKQDSYLVSFFLEKPTSTEQGASPPLSPGGSMGSDREKPEYSLVDSLLVLTKSEDSRVAIKACEGLLLVTSILEDTAASVIVLYTAFCERMADQLSKLFRCLPQVLDPADINQSNATWGFDHDDQYGTDFLGKRQLTAFLSWLDYVNQLSIEAHPMVSKSLAQAIRERFILTAIDSGLSQASEPCAITVTAILTRCLKLVSSPTLAQEFAIILLGNEMSPEIPDHQSPHKLRRLLIQRINHLSDQLAVETLRLFQGLLKLAYQPIIDTLVVRNFQTRNYLDFRRIKSKSTTRTSSISSTTSSKKIDTGAKSETAPIIGIIGDTITEVSPKNDEKIPDTEFSSDTYDNESTDSKVVDTGEGELNATIASIENISEEKSNEHIEAIVNETSSSNIINTSSEQTAENTSDEASPLKVDNSNNNTRSVETMETGEENNSQDTAQITEQNENTELKSTSETEQSLDESAASLLDQSNDLEVEEGIDELHGASINNIEEETLDYLNSPKGFNKRKVEKAVNGFLLLLPETLRTSGGSTTETGYDSYLREAHRQCDQRSKQTRLYDWPTALKEAITDDEKEEEAFYEGAFLNTIFRRLERMLDQPYEINLEVTGILSLLCQFRHPFLHEFLVDTSGVVKDSVFTLHRILLKVCQDVKTRGVRNLQNLSLARKNLMAEKVQDTTDIPDQMFLDGIIVYEEFCKELAAIAFVSSTMEFNQNEDNFF
ncbi:FHF complex subunit HOOK interacting protein 2A-like [Clytia hemisphaerica]|uniref:FHF complex subunit HOOK-interacting protein C-terminal domain-containing protein n=1 Tax=Clytia hemisphaerica TaxID=252671 RepID=A0A7M5WVN8_9CNID